MDQKQFATKYKRQAFKRAEHRNRQAMAVCQRKRVRLDAAIADLKVAQADFDHAQQHERDTGLQLDSARNDLDAMTQD